MEYEDIKKIIQDMSDSKLNSLSLEFPDGVKISLTKDTNTQNVNTIPTQDTKVSFETEPEVKENVKKEERQEECNIVKSPMVGTCYLKSAPDKDEYVKVGDKVKKGQVLCIIEAMKLMNEIESEYDGQIVEVCAKNEEMVDYGKPLFKIK